MTSSSRPAAPVSSPESSVFVVSAGGAPLLTANGSRVLAAVLGLAEEAVARVLRETANGGECRLAGNRRSFLGVYAFVTVAVAKAV